MKKLRTSGPFLLLLILSVALVNLAIAQETPTVVDGRVTQHQPLAGQSLVKSNAETQIQLSTDPQTMALSTGKVQFAPPEEIRAQGPDHTPDSPAVPLPDELQSPIAPAEPSATEVEITLSDNPQQLDPSGYRVSLPRPSPSPSAAGETCTQLFKNTKLDVVGTAFPNWDILSPIVYYSTSDYVSPSHSAVLVDADSGDPSPTVDAFAQAISTPSNLNKVVIRYATKTANSNSTDRALGNIYTVDAGGGLDEFIGGWEVSPSGGWQWQTVTITDRTFLDPMEGEDLAIILWSSTSGGGTAEVVFFDDVTFTACEPDTANSRIIVKKVSNPSSSTQKFTFNPSWSGTNFQLSHNQTKTSPALPPGNYSVKELAQSGWKLTSATCSDGSSPNNISLQAGETVTCTFRNTKDAFIRVRKETDPNGATQKFTFNPSWSGSNFQLSDGQIATSAALAPGTYNVKELPQSGWNLTSATCNDGSSPNSISLSAGETVTCTFNNKKGTTPPPDDNCKQMLVNTALDIVEFGDGTGTAEPWAILDPIVYYDNDPDWAFDGYSLLFWDGDSGDPNPEQDSLAQALQLPRNLTEMEIEYMRATYSTNSTDRALGNLWLLDDDWVLDLGNPDNFVGGWELGQKDGTWVKETVTVSSAAQLNKMSGRKIVIILFSRTNGGGTREEVYFDNVKLNACTKKVTGTNKVYMPVTMHSYGKTSGPICSPPTENPADQWHSNRGLVQTSATCNSTLSNVDRADYYTFKPTKSGSHILRLTNLPSGSQWAAMAFFDQAAPDYAPGGASDGTCRITQPGAGNKQVVCTFDRNRDYFIKVSSGSTPIAGSYRMRITGP